MTADIQPLRREHRPSHRSLRVFTFDPSLDVQLETAVINQMTLDVPWEKLEPGPVGEYLEVVDVDPASGLFYPPVDLDHPAILAEHGLDPSEGDPQFHQQMVYAVAMTTIKNFERALGRRVLWSRPMQEAAGEDRYGFVRRLRIYPHALREANAYYSPTKKALLFGYFPAAASTQGANLPGGTVFTCLSHDIVVHELTHALLDGLHRSFAESSNPDVLAFHEAFADLVALFQHFSQPEALAHQIARTRGDLGRQNLLAQLAQQFGQATGRSAALRDALGEVVDGEWRPKEPDPRALARVHKPHARGSILVAAVFDAFLALYKRRIADLLRIATGGSGVLPEGELHPDLTARLAKEAAKTARHLLRLAIRALDYCPPVDITFGDYLRAMITADHDLVPEDPWGYRIALIEAFRRRGIYPADVRSLSVESLLWRPPRGEEREWLEGIFQVEEKKGKKKKESRERRLRPELRLDWSLRTEREAIAERIEKIGGLLNKKYFANRRKSDLAGLALDGDSAKPTVNRNDDGEPVFEVRAVRPVYRTSPDGESITDLVVSILQKRRGYFEPPLQSLADSTRPEDREKADREARGRGFTFRGGATLIVDMKSGEVRYVVTKNVHSDRRLAAQRDYRSRPDGSLAATYLSDAAREAHGEPFALLHRHWEEEPE